MTILQMKYFIKVCENGSLNLASKQLFVSQPALTNTINQLEKEFNLLLFNRTNHGLIMTKEGEYFYQKAKQIIESFDTFDRELKELAEQKHTIRIGVPPMIGSFLFPEIYSGYKRDHIDARFEIWEEGSLSIRKKIQDKTLDIGFSILNDNYNERYQKEVILETELLFCISKENPLAKREHLSVEDIAEEPIILMKEGFYQNKLINSLYTGINKAPNITLVSSQLSVIHNFVKMNAGGAFLMKELVDGKDDSIVGISMKNPLKLSVGLIWSKDATLHIKAIDFINWLKQNKPVINKTYTI